MPQSSIRIKTPEQIEGIRLASRLAAETLDHIGTFVRVGISTEQLDTICNEFIVSKGGKSACMNYLGSNRWWKGHGAYTRYTCISRNDIVCHGVPNTREILTDGDILNIDVTVILGGYFGDTSRMYSVGAITSNAQRLIDSTRACLEAGIRQVHPSNHYGDIGFAIGRLARARGYSVVSDYGGHGVGVEFHEDPFVPHDAPEGSGALLKAGMIFTIEPMINEGTMHTRIDADEWTVRTRDGKLSAQMEHTILVTETGCEVLTAY